MKRPWVRLHKDQLVVEQGRRRQAPRPEPLPRWAQLVEDVIRRLFPTWAYRRERARREHAAMVAAEARRREDEAFGFTPPPVTGERVRRAWREADTDWWSRRWGRKWRW